MNLTTSINAVDLGRAKSFPAGQIRRERIWSREERPEGSGQDSPEKSVCVKPSPAGEGWVTTAWMQEVEQRKERLPRGKLINLENLSLSILEYKPRFVLHGNQNKDKSLFKSPHPNPFDAAQDRLLPKEEGAYILKSKGLGAASRSGVRVYKKPKIVTVLNLQKQTHINTNSKGASHGLL